MKFLYKLTGIGLMIALMFTFGFVNPTLSASAATGYAAPVVGAGLVLGKYVSEYDYEDVVAASNKIRLPDVTPLIDSTNCHLEVRDSTQAVIPWAWDSAGSYYYFNLPSGKVGPFTANYSLTSAGQVVTQKSIIIKVNGITPTFNFDTNSPQIIPTKTIPNKKIVLPNPEVLDNEGEVIENAAVSVEIASPNHSVVSIGTEDGFRHFTPAEGITGIYHITYSYKAPGTKSVKQTFAVTVVSESNFKPTGTDANIVLGMKLSGVPETVNLGVETVFPKATGFNDHAQSNKEEIPVYTEILIEHRSDTPVAATTVKDYKHTFTVAGEYLVTYKIKDFFGNTLEHSFLIRKASDTTTPTIRVVDDYTTLATDTNAVGGVLPIDAKEIDDFEDVSYKIPSIVGTTTDLGDPKVIGPKIVVPAIYAKDNVDKYATMAGSQQSDPKIPSKFERELVRKTGGTVTRLGLDKEPYETVEHTFTSSDVGEWTLRFKVYDSTNVSASVLEYTIIVKDGTYRDDRAPEITFNGLPSTKQHGDEFTVLKPTVADYVDSSLTEVADANVRVVTEYFFNDIAGTIALAEEKESDKAYFEFKVPSKIDLPAPNSPVTKMTIRVTATDDAGNVGIFEKEITIIDTTSDVSSPLLVDATTGVSKTLDSTLQAELDTLYSNVDDLSQNKSIKLPELSFMDQGTNSIDRVYPSVIVTDSTGTVVSVNRINIEQSDLTTNDIYDTSGYEPVLIGRVTTIENLQFFAASSGEYTITYSVHDNAGNSYTFAYTIGVANKTPPSINVDKLATSAEWGDLIDLQEIVVTSGGIPQSYTLLSGTPVLDSNGNATDLLKSGDSSTKPWPIKTVIVDVSNDKVFPEFKFDALVAKKGTYTIRFWAKDAEGNITTNYVQRTIIARDSKAPELFFEEEPVLQHIYDSTASDPTVNDITIPGFGAEDAGSGVDFGSARIVVKYSDSSTPLGEFTGTEERIVRATKSGTLEITYSIADTEKNAVQKTFRMAVGDLTDPIIEIANPSRNTPGNQKLGYVLSINRDDLTLRDEGVAISNSRISISVKLNGAEMTQDASSTTTVYEYTINVAGTVVITYTATDEVGNEAQAIICSFVVSGDSGDPVLPGVIWGTVLLVVAILALGGVIFYFVKPAKGSKKGAQTRPTSKK